jgi:hypothetical protein
MRLDSSKLLVPLELTALLRLFLERNARASESRAESEEAAEPVPRH